MDIYSLSAVVVLLIAVVFAIVQNRKKSEQIKQFEERFAEVLDVDKEVESVTAQKVEVEGALRELRSSYAEKRAIFDKLVKESAIYDEMVQLAELGFYKPHFDFDASEEYKNLIGDVRGGQKTMLTEKTAIFSSKEWVLDGSKVKGKTLMNRGIRLTARAFNNEAISEFPKWRKYLISLSFRDKSSVRPVQVGGFEANIVVHRSTAVRGRGGPPPPWESSCRTRTGPVEADGTVDAQNAPTAPWKTLRVFHELPQGLSHRITHAKPRKAPKWRWETRIDPIMNVRRPCPTLVGTMSSVWNKGLERPSMRLTSLMNLKQSRFHRNIGT